MERGTERLLFNFSLGSPSNQRKSLVLFIRLSLLDNSGYGSLFTK